jgi:5-methyltetrahydrofolate corrinoid/iron sulfur protein methyltransferase
MEVIGEKINASRKPVEKAVKERNADFIQDLARRQVEAGADYLDVNCGLALYAEEEANDLAWLVSIIQDAVDVPLCIDSTRALPIETALKLHRGKAIVNSVDGDPARLEAILPMVKESQCRLVALTSSKEEGIPSTCGGRMAIAERIARAVERQGIPLADVYFDPLVMPIATNQTSAVSFLETLAAIKRTFGDAKTISGLSNISFGLPKRKLLNQAFLVLCLGAHMDAAIIDPTDKAIMALIQASESLTGEDPYCARYLKAFRAGRLDY